MTTTDSPQPSTGLWDAIHALHAQELLNGIDTIDAAESYRVLQCLNACTYTVWGLVFRLARRLDQLVANPAELPANCHDDPAAVLHSIATVMLMAERSLNAAQESTQTAREDMAVLFPQGHR